MDHPTPEELDITINTLKYYFNESIIEHVQMNSILKYLNILLERYNEKNSN